MKYLLDTNACIRGINGRSPSVRTKILSFAPEEIVVCSVVRAELFYGSSKSNTPLESRRKQDLFLSPFPSLPFDDIAANTYGIIRADLEKIGKAIGPMDMQIAAIAIAHGLTLVTHNTREFSRIKNLIFEDWE